MSRVQVLGGSESGDEKPVQRYYRFITAGKTSDSLVGWFLMGASSRGGDTYLAGTLSAAVHSPFIFVLVHNAVVEANAAVDVHLLSKQCAVDRLRGKKKEGGGGLAQDGKVPLCQGSSTNESAAETVIKTLLDSTEAVQMPPTAKKYLCIHMGLIRDLAVDPH